MRGRFDVTGKLRPAKKNALAVRVKKNATPGSVNRRRWRRPARTAERWELTIPPTTLPSAGIGFRRFAGATPASGAMSR